MRLLAFFWILIMATPAQASECVVLLHGLARSSSSMLLMEWRLKREGYDVVNVDYPSTANSIETLASSVVPQSLYACREAAKVHFVTHSMGGILLRYYMKTASRRPARLGRTVMLGPPNQGSPVVDQMTVLPGFELWNGPAGLQLGTGEDSLPRRLGPVDFELGVIAGSQSISPLLSSFMDGPNDGKVPVTSTAVKGMRDHIVMPVTHTFMMNNPKVQDQVVAFLKTGRFQRD